MNHGGEVYDKCIQYDFSVNLNPHRVPDQLIEALHSSIDKCSCYPDGEQRRIRELLARINGLDSANVFCGNGASELIVGICNYIRPARALLVNPCFSGYERALQSTGVTKIISALQSEDIPALIDESLDIIIVANPTNPQGRLWDDEYIRNIISKCCEMNVAIVIDECFIELSNGRSVADLVPHYGNLFVLRAFTKLFALPGVRFGYVLSSEDNICGIRQILPEWNVSVMALEMARVGAELLITGDFVKESLEIIDKEKAYLVRELEKLGLRVEPSDSCFVLVDTGDEEKKRSLFSGLLQSGILVRDCSNFKGCGDSFIRIAVKDHEANDFLISRMRVFIDEY